jgi:hypothetical protein
VKSTGGVQGEAEIVFFRQFGMPGLPQMVCRFKGDDSGLCGIGYSPGDAIADLHEWRTWEAERIRLAQAPPAERFARASGDLLQAIAREKRAGWQVTGQRTSFDSEAGGEVQVTLHWDPAHGRVVP